MRRALGQLRPRHWYEIPILVFAFTWFAIALLAAHWRYLVTITLGIVLGVMLYHPAGRIVLMLLCVGYAVVDLTEWLLPDEYYFNVYHRYPFSLSRRLYESVRRKQ